jgi:glycosyltransferase involved in cell wall biosynthesis
MSVPINLCSLSAIMPAYDEEQGIEAAVVHTIETFETLAVDFEVIIVNDCSSDETGSIAESLALRYPKVYCCHHETNLGSGEAFKTGIRKATKDYVVFVPADSPLDPGDLQAYFSRIGVCDIVVGSRVERVGYSRFARLSSFMYNRIFVPLLFNIGLEDVNWIQMYRRQLFTDNIIKYNSTSIFWLVEILVHARNMNLIIVEVPARMKRRMYGKATSMRLSMILRTFIEMTQFFLRLRKADRLKRAK